MKNRHSSPRHGAAEPRASLAAHPSRPSTFPLPLATRIRHAVALVGAGSAAAVGVFTALDLRAGGGPGLNDSLGHGNGQAAFVVLSLATAAAPHAAVRTVDPEGWLVRHDVHRAAALCGLVLVVVHVVTALPATYPRATLSALVPFAGGLAVLTVGALALYALVAAAVSGALRGRFTVSIRAVRVWRPLHLLGYAAWMLSAAHLLLAAASDNPRLALVTLIVGAALVAAGYVNAYLSRIRGRP